MVRATGVGSHPGDDQSAYDEAVRAWLGLREQETIVGFVHIGTPKVEAPERERPDPRALLTVWNPA